MDQRDRVAIVLPYAAAANAERDVYTLTFRERRLAELLSEMGWRVRGFGTTTRPERVVMSESRTPWEYLPVDASDVRLPRASRRSAALEDAVARWGPAGIVLKAAGTRAGDRIARAHTGFLSVILGGNFRAFGLTAADLVLIESEQQYLHLRQWMNEDRVMALPKLVRPEFVQRPAANPDRMFDVVVVSSFTPFKNHAAITGLFDNPVSIAFLGDGPTRSDVERQARQGRARAVFYGAVEPATVAEVMGAAAIFVHPSLSEGFPRAAAEAMMCGLPVVAVEGVVGSPVRHLVNGLLVDEAALVPAVTKLLLDEALRQRLGASARATALEHFADDALGRAAVDLSQKFEQELVTPARQRRRRRALQRARRIRHASREDIVTWVKQGNRRMEALRARSTAARTADQRQPPNL